MFLLFFAIAKVSEALADILDDTVTAVADSAEGFGEWLREDNDENN